MYVPVSFAVTDRQQLHQFIQQHSFATLVSIDGGRPTASHLPLLLDAAVEPHGRLIGHMARANPQWRSLDSQSVLAIFHGPHAYVSPTWYQEPNVVPTWNYVAVHATGSLRLVTDRTELFDIVRRTVDVYEANMPTPWTLAQADAGFIDGLLDGIIGFTIDIARLEGKWKLNQNHSLARRQRVAAALRESTRPTDHDVAALMADSLDA